VIDEDENQLVTKKAIDALLHEHAGRQQACAYAGELTGALR
jgi:hypothetical protein